MGPFAGVDYSLALCQLHSRLQHIYRGQTYARVELNPIPKSSRLCPPGRDFEFRLWEKFLWWQYGPESIDAL